MTATRIVHFGLMIAIALCAIVPPASAQSGTLTTLHTFGMNGLDGGYPEGGLIQAKDGNFYGTTPAGGNSIYGSGTAFRITPAGQYTVLHTFGSYNGNPALTDGSFPTADLVQGRDGNLYGTTGYGGYYGYGTVFKLTLAGAETILHSFPDGVDSIPVTPLVLGSDGNFYGLTNSEFYRIMPDGEYTDLGSALGGNGFVGASGGLIQASDGNFYGAMWANLYEPYGAVYQLKPDGVGKVLYSFTGGADGSDPTKPLVQGTDGDFYGMTYGDTGTTPYGTIYRLHYLDPLPTLTQLSPNTLPAGGPAFTLTVSGKNFAADASVNWNGAPLTTTFVSANKLTAAVPASAIAATGSAAVTVTNPAPGGGTTAALTFTVTVTSLSVKVGTLTRNSGTGAITVPLTLKHTGYASALSLMITSATLSQAGTTTALPVNLGTLAAGASTTTSLTFPGSAGASGTSATLQVSGTYTGGSFSFSKAVRLP